MKKLILTLVLILNVFIVKSQCTYTENSIPSIVYANQTLCINNNKTVSWGALTVQNGGLIIISNNSTFTFSGSLYISPGGKIQFMDCGSKLVIPSGSYTGGNPNDCEMEVYNCESAVNPLTATNPAYDDWCKIEPLPVELISYTCNNKEILWSTGSEINSDYFTVLYSDNGMDFTPVTNINAQGNSFEVVNYSYPITKKGYYRLTQTDYDGTTEKFDIKFCGPDVDKITLVARYDVLGQIIQDSYRGIVIEVYSDGSTKTIYKK